MRTAPFQIKGRLSPQYNIDRCCGRKPIEQAKLSLKGRHIKQVSAVIPANNQLLVAHDLQQRK